MKESCDFKTKYRLSAFSEVIGNKRTVGILRNMIESSHIGNGILFFGPPGSGKTSLARLLVKALHCQGFSGDVCGKCAPCSSFGNGSPMGVDYSFHDCSGINGKEMEDILRSLRFPSFSTSRLKIHILDEFHRAKEPLQERFLIPLETFKGILLIFCLIDLTKVNEAFRQRVTVLRTCGPEIDELVPWLEKVCIAEKIIVKDSNALRQVALSAGQLPRECLNLLQSLSLTGDPLTTRLVKELAQDIAGPTEKGPRFTPAE